MHFKNNIVFFFIFLITSHLSAEQVQQSGIDWQSDHNRYIHSLGSLSYHVQMLEDFLLIDAKSELTDLPTFAPEDVENLWNRVLSLSKDQLTAQEAYECYYIAKVGINSEKTLTHLIKAKDSLQKLLNHAIEEEEHEDSTIHLDREVIVQAALRKQANFAPYPHLTKEMKIAFSKYLITSKHPMRKVLDKIFSHSRITKDKASFLRAGFKIISERPRSYVIVARHPLLKDYLVKCYFDTETREKWHKPSWKWLTQRCIGAKKIDTIIKRSHIKHFRVAKKWLYIQPIIKDVDPSSYQRHPVILLVTDMKLVPERENLYAWRNYMNHEKLDELYYIITRAKGASYRADNVAYSRSGKFCFIDCEYPSKGPEYYRVGRELNKDMVEYWNKLVTHGGK